MEIAGKCPFLEDKEATWATLPFCVIDYKEPLCVILEEYCYEEKHINCPNYIKAKKEWE